jgi:hypothetical protein
MFRKNCAKPNRPKSRLRAWSISPATRERRSKREGEREKEGIETERDREKIQEKEGHREE